MEEQKTCACGMPLSEATACSCEPAVCVHCCACPDNCACGCKQKQAAQ